MSETAGMTHEVAVRVRGYLVVFGALLVLTLATVAAASMELPIVPTVAIGLLIATAKAALVALFFMHLINERKIVYLALALTAVIFAALFGLTLWAEGDHILGTRFTHPFG
jgi:cytochrome c oxidase subunit 4